jgi:Family of unknown function (DUF6311)
VGAVVGGLYFLAAGDLHWLQPNHVDWLFRNIDSAWHYASWEFYRRDAWRWPPGAIGTLLVPIGTSIGQTDSIPLAAFLLKPFSDLLEPAFQYFGGWLFACYLLQGIFAAALLHAAGAPVWARFAGTALLVLDPRLAIEWSHAARAAHWLVIAAIGLYLRSAERLGRALVYWLLVLAAAAATNPYLMLMVLALAGADLLRGWLVDRVLTVRHLGFECLAMVLTAASVSWLAGYFVIRPGALVAGELGHWSMNVLAPLDPAGWSILLPDLPRGPGQYEGFAYFGLGNLVLLVAALLIGLRRPPRRTTLMRMGPLAGVCVLLTLAALSPRIFVGRWLVATLPTSLFLPLAPFRASGRLFLPVSYVALMIALCLVWKRLRPLPAAALVAGCVLIQAVDLSPGLAALRREHSVGHAIEGATAQRESWAPVLSGARKLLLLPPAWSDADSLPLALQAARAGLATNGGTAARIDHAALYQYRRTFNLAIDAGRLEPGAVYVVHPQEEARFQPALERATQCRRWEGYLVCGATVR